MKVINEIIKNVLNGPIGQGPFGKVGGITGLSFLGLCVIGLIICVIAILYLSCIAMRRNNRVYKIRTWMLENYLKLYRYLPSYDEMMRGWYKIKTWKKEYWLNYAMRECNKYEAHTCN